MPRIVAALIVAALAFLAPTAMATLKVQGTPANKSTFVEMLGKLTGHDYSIDENGEITDQGASAMPDSCACHCLAVLVNTIIADNGEVVLVNAQRSVTGGVVDRFKGKQADLDDLEMIPECPPGDQVSRGEAIAHILGEYYYAAKNNSGYGTSHATGGIAEQNKHRAASGKTPVKSVSRPDNAPETEIVLEDGRKEIWEIDSNDNIQSITPPPPAEQFAFPNTAAMSDSIAFLGTIISKGSAPCSWSGVQVATIEVQYQVVQVLAGTPGSTVTVEHAVVEAPATCQTPAIYNSTQPLLVTANLVTGFSRGTIYMSLEEPTSAVPALSYWAILLLLALLLATGMWLAVRTMSTRC